MSFRDLYDELKRGYFSAYDTSFVTGDSPVTHDIKTGLSNNAVEAVVYNFGAGDLTFAITSNGTDYGSEIIVPAGAIWPVHGISIDSIRVTWVADTKYSVVAR